jgi:hypothetical protein
MGWADDRTPLCAHTPWKINRLQSGHGAMLTRAGRAVRNRDFFLILGGLTPASMTGWSNGRWSDLHGTPLRSGAHPRFN